MSTLVPPPPSRSEERHDAEALEALIEEARRRARRRRRGYAALSLVALAAGLLGFLVLDSGGGTGTAAGEGEGAVGAQINDGRWRPATGLEGGTVTALAVDPQNPETVFAATDQAGVFKSADGGRTWRSLNLPSRMGRSDAIAIPPADPETLYVGTGRGVAKTTDGGRSWRLTGSDLRGKTMRGEWYYRGLGTGTGFVYTLVVDQRDPDIVYAGTWNRGVLKSTDGGASWRRTALGAVGQLLVDPRDPGTIYAAAVGAVIRYGDAMEKVSDAAGQGRGGVFKSSDQGESWDPVGLQGTVVHALALDPEHPGTMYAGTDERGVLKTTDGGATWRDAGLIGQTITGLTLDPSNTGILYATLKWEEGVFKNEDGGRSRSWRTFHAGTPAVGTGHGFTTALALDPRNPATIYVARSGDLPFGGGGVSKSLDGGRSWRPTNAGLNGARVSALAVAPGSPGTAYAVVAGRGVFKRADGRWRAVAVKTALMGPWGDALAVDPQDPATVYGGSISRISKSTNGGASWRASLREVFHDDWAHSGLGLAVDPQHPATVHAITASHDAAAGYESHVFRSRDGGRTWSESRQVQAVDVPDSPGATLDRPVLTPPLAIDPLNPDTLYAGGVGVQRSVDGGRTWRRAGLRRSAVLSLAVDPEDTAVLYAGTDAGLSKSTNAGATWQPLQGALDDVRVEALAIDPMYRRTVIAGTDRGVFWSTDGGDRWRRFTRLPPRTFDVLAMDRSAGLLYAGANGAGIYELELAH